jgi:hypothetical protein
MSRYKMLGNVNLLGLNEYGRNPGMSPMWGALIGGGVSGGVSLALGHMTTGRTQQNRDIIGLGAGLAVSGVMYSMKSTRHAAFGAMLGSFLAAGLSWLERMLFGTVQLPAATAATASAIASGAPSGVQGLGIATTRALNGLGISTTRALNGLGIATTQQRTSPVGTIPGVAGLRLGNGRPPVNLMGQQTAASRQVQLMGGPPIHGIAGQWGATHFSR